MKFPQFGRWFAVAAGAALILLALGTVPGRAQGSPPEMTGTSDIYTRMDIHHARILGSLAGHEMMEGNDQAALQNLKNATRILASMVDKTTYIDGSASDKKTCIENGKRLLYTYVMQDGTRVRYTSSVSVQDPPDPVDRTANMPENDDEAKEDPRLNERMELNPGLNEPWFLDSPLAATEKYDLMCPDAMNLLRVADDLLSKADYRSAVTALDAAACSLDQCVNKTGRTH